MNQTPETRRGTVEGETKAMVNKDERGPKKLNTMCEHLFGLTNKPDKQRHCQMRYVTGSGCRLHVHEQTRAHTCPSGASCAAEQNAGGAVGPLSSTATLTWKLSQARASTSTFMSPEGNLSRSQIPAAGLYKSSILDPRACNWA